MNITASDLADASGPIDVADHYVFVSESGRSPEPIRVAERCAHGRRIAITNADDSPLSETVDAVLSLGGFDDSRVYTSGYTATLLAYDLLVRRQLVDSAVGPALDAAALVGGVMYEYGPQIADAAQWLESVRAIDLVGRDVSYAAAAEGALLLREAARIHTAAFETYQYLHGPMESIADDSAVVAFGEGRELSMVSAILEANTPVLLVTQADAVDIGTHDRLRVLRLPLDVRDFGRAIAEATVMQQLSGKLAERRGFDVDEFRFDQPDTKISVSAGYRRYRG